jgi:hypothetical protein
MSNGLFALTGRVVRAVFGVWLFAEHLSVKRVCIVRVGISVSRIENAKQFKYHCYVRGEVSLLASINLALLEWVGCDSLQSSDSFIGIGRHSCEICCTCYYRDREEVLGVMSER